MECEGFSLAVGCSCMLCKHAVSTRTCSIIQLLPGLQTEGETARRSYSFSRLSRGLQVSCKCADLLPIVLRQTGRNSIHLVKELCHLSIAESNYKNWWKREKKKYIPYKCKYVKRNVYPSLGLHLISPVHWSTGACDKNCNSPYTKIK